VSFSTNLLLMRTRESGMPSRRNHSSARWRHVARADGQGGQNQNQFCGYPSRPRNPPGLWLSTHPAPGRALASPHGAVLAPATAMRGAAKVIEIRVSDIALVGKRRHSCRRFFVSRLQIPALTFIALLDALVNPLDSPALCVPNTPRDLWQSGLPPHHEHWKHCSWRF
jgi:hypothetical protein